MTRAVLSTPATPSYCAAMTVGTMVKRFAHVRFLVDCLWVQPLFTLSVPCDIFRTPALIWGRFIDSGNQVGRTRSDIHAAGPRRCQSQIVLLLLGCKAGLILFFWNPTSTLVFGRHSKWLKWWLCFTNFPRVFVHLYYFFETLFQPSYLGNIPNDLSDSCVLQIVPGFWFIYSIFWEPYSNPRI